MSAAVTPLDTLKARELAARAARYWREHGSRAVSLEECIAETLAPFVAEARRVRDDLDVMLLDKAAGLAAGALEGVR